VCGVCVAFQRNTYGAVLAGDGLDWQRAGVGAEVGNQRDANLAARQRQTQQMSRGKSAVWALAMERANGLIGHIF
jgi:predicted kinase